MRSPRIDPLLSTWCVAYLAFDLAVGNMHADEFRLLLPLFPLSRWPVGVAVDPAGDPLARTRLARESRSDWWASTHG